MQYNIELIFSVTKYGNVASMFLELGLPSFNTMIYNSVFSFVCSLVCCDNMLLSSLLAYQPTDN